MGDGSITKRRLTISLNLETDKPYSTFVINLIKELFQLKPNVYILDYLSRAIQNNFVHHF